MKITIILVALCAAGFAVPLALGGQIYDEYGFSRNNLVADPLVLVTSIFLHGSLEHLLSNVLVLLFFGLAVEKELGWRRITTIFFLGSFAGDALSLFAYAPNSIAVGASAGIFALIGVGMLVKPMDMETYPLTMPIPLAVLGIGYALYNVFGFVTGIDPDVSYIAHFGGLFVGLLFGMRHKLIDAGGVRQSWKKGWKIVAITFLLMVVVPLVWMLMR